VSRVPHWLRFLLFAVFMFLVGRYLEGPVANWVAQSLGLHPNELSPAVVAIQEVVSLAEILLLTGAASLLERKRIDSYGLPIRSAFGGVYGGGFLAGMAVVVFVGGAMVAAGGMKVSGFALHGVEAWKSMLAWLAAMVMLGINEEYLFRGYALQALWRSAGFWPATVVTTALFAAAHVTKPHENLIDITIIVAIGLALCLSVRSTGSLWWATGFHAAFDFGQFFLIGTKNGGSPPVGHLLDVSFPGPAWITGGELGTEASGFMIPAALAILIFTGCFQKKPAHRSKVASSTS